MDNFKRNPTNTLRGFHVETTWKRPFPRRFNVDSTWCVCREIWKASLPVRAHFSNDLNWLLWKPTKDKFRPSWGYFGRSSKNIYNLLKIMLHFTSWTLILILHIRQSIYLVLTNVLSTSFLMFQIAFDQISLKLSIQFW